MIDPSYLSSAWRGRPGRWDNGALWLLAVAAVVLFVLLLLPGCGLVGDGDEADGAVPVTGAASADGAVPDGTAEEGPAGESVGPVGTLRMAVGVPANSLNPHDDQTPATFSVYGWIYEGLVRQAADGSFEPWLAESWQVRDDGQTVVFDLHEGVEFSDGAPFDAAAVKANLDFVRTGPPDQVIPPVAGQLANVADVEVVHDHQVAVHLSSPGEIALVSWLSRNSGLMVSPASLGRAGSAPVGTGPYVYNSAESSADLTRLVLDANRGYWQPEEVGVERVEMDVINDPQSRKQAFEAGQYDLVMASLDLGAPAGALESVGPSVIFSFTVVDWQGEQVPQLADRDVRCAMAQALNREGLAVQATAPPEAVRYQWAGSDRDYAFIEDLEVPGFDIEAAAEAFAGTGEDGFEFASGFMPGTPFETGAVAWAGALNELGITMRTEALDPPSGGEMFAAFTQGRYPVQIIPVNEPHPLMTLLQRATTGGTLNPSGAVPDGVEELVVSAAQKSNEEAETDIEAAWKIMLEECIWVPYLTLYDGYWYAPHVTGVEKVSGIPVHMWPHGVRVDG